MTVLRKQKILHFENDKFYFIASLATLQGKQMQPTMASAAGLTMQLSQPGTESFQDVWIRCLMLFNILLIK